MASYPTYASSSNTTFNASSATLGSAKGLPVSSSRPAINPAAAAASAAAFKGPAHKHAHHLHSIPPREKSTRTLIIDHMLWVHARTRFAQARAELGMTDKTGGSASPNYAHRFRPEYYDEDEEAASDSEDYNLSLTARSGDEEDYEDQFHSSQDLALARSLRLRAIGLENVVTSMLDQPPPFHPLNDDDLLTPPTSPKALPVGRSQRDPKHPHAVPNGVRMRLALGTVVNDFFARQAPAPSLHDQVKCSREAQSASSPSVAESMSPPSHTLAKLSSLPCALYPLVSVSALSVARPSSPASSRNAIYRPVTQKQIQTPSPRVRSLYISGADPSTANSPPAMRCPRHLHHGCEICVEAKERPSYKGGRSNSRTRSASSAGGATPTNILIQDSPTHVSESGGITGWQDGPGIGSGLAGPGPGGSVLRRLPLAWTADSSKMLVRGLEGNIKLARVLPRFIRLSALVAVELGREARGDLSDAWTSPSLSPEQTSLPSNPAGADNLQPLPAPSSGDVVQAINRVESSRRGNITIETTSVQQRRQQRLYSLALRPSREWYLMLAGILTRAVLQGYLSAGWRGNEAIDCLLTFGLGLHDSFDAHSFGLQSWEEEADDRKFEEFEPDDLPSLRDAVTILFPSLRSGASGEKDREEAEYEREMDDRAKKFYSIPTLTPDLATHMEDLAWTYPAEPVERAILRYVEALAKWRGKPELEKNKKMSSKAPTRDMMPIDSLVHTSPTGPDNPAVSITSRRPSIENFFLPLTSDSQIHEPTSSGTHSNKRVRSPDDSRTGPSKRTNTYN